MNILRFLIWMGQRGHRTVLYAHAESRLLREVEEAGIHTRIINSSFRYGDIVNARKLARLTQTDNVDVLTLQQSPDIFLGVLAKKLAGGQFKLVYSQQMHIGGDKKDMFHSWEYGHFDAWVTPLPWLAERVKEKTTIKPERIHVIPHGIELERFTHGLPDKQDARKQLELPRDVSLAGVIGRLDPKKGQDVAIKAVARVRSEGHPIHLVIVGDETHQAGDSYASYLRTLVSELHLEKVVHFCPHQQQPELAYAALDIFVLASKSETYGMVTIEAMASGLPVIGTAEGGTLDLIQPDKNGLLFTPMSDADLATSLTRYLNDRNFAARLSHQAKQDAIDRYSHIRQCEGWESLMLHLDD